MGTMPADTCCTFGSYDMNLSAILTLFGDLIYNWCEDQISFMEKPCNMFVIKLRSQPISQ
jgi:hypothetical protein